jgi:hypothetical protein
MSEGNEYLPVIQKLLERTREGKVAWEESSSSFGVISEGVSSTSFRAVVKSYTFVISKMEDQGDIKITLRMLDDRGAEIFEIQVADDPVTLGRNRQMVSELKELHELARRKALNVEAKIGEVSGFLDQL